MTSVLIAVGKEFQGFLGRFGLHWGHPWLRHCSDDPATWVHGSESHVTTFPPFVSMGPLPRRCGAGTVRNLRDHKPIVGAPQICFKFPISVWNAQDLKCDSGQISNFTALPPPQKLGKGWAKYLGQLSLLQCMIYVARLRNRSA